MFVCLYCRMPKFLNMKTSFTNNILIVLVTGAKGQLGSEIQRLSSNYNFKFLFADKSSLDLSDRNQMASYFKNNKINTVINCAAYTSVDKAETDFKIADTVNHLAVCNLAEISKMNNCKLIHISSDYVYNGRNYKPYTESDTTNPCSVYGKTKLAGENCIQKLNIENSIIIRTSWLYSSYGTNFVKTMLKLGNEKKTLDVVCDQVGTPTYARDLAKTILDILPNIQNKNVEIYNYSNEGVLSWYDFAKEIIKMNKLDCNINPIESKDYPSIVERPYYSVMNKAKIKNDFNISIPYWRDSLKECLDEIKYKEEN